MGHLLVQIERYDRGGSIQSQTAELGPRPCELRTSTPWFSGLNELILAVPFPGMLLPSDREDLKTDRLRSDGDALAFLLSDLQERLERNHLIGGGAVTVTFVP